MNNLQKVTQIGRGEALSMCGLDTISKTHLQET
jgi:hypothetical protein